MRFSILSFSLIFSHFHHSWVDKIGFIGKWSKWKLSDFSCLRSNKSLIYLKRKSFPKLFVIYAYHQFSLESAELKIKQSFGNVYKCSREFSFNILGKYINSCFVLFGIFPDDFPINLGIIKMYLFKYKLECLCLRFTRGFTLITID